MLKVIATTFLFLLLSIQSVSAQNCTTSADCTAPTHPQCAGTTCSCIATYCVAQPSGLITDFTKPEALGFAVTRLFAFTLPVVGILGFLYFLWAGFQFLTSQGNPKALDAAKARLTYATIGMIIVFLAYLLTQFFLNLFGLQIL
jgi:hypothetical protein